MMWNNPENLSADKILRKLRSLNHGIIMAYGPAENRNKRYEILESYGEPVQISKEEWVKLFCV